MDIDLNKGQIAPIWNKTIIECISRGIDDLKHEEFTELVKVIFKQKYPGEYEIYVKYDKMGDNMYSRLIFKTEEDRSFFILKYL